MKDEEEEVIEWMLDAEMNSTEQALVNDFVKRQWKEQDIKMAPVISLPLQNGRNDQRPGSKCDLVLILYNVYDVSGTVMDGIPSICEINSFIHS